VDTSPSELELELEAVPPPAAGSGILAVVDSSGAGINAGWRAAIVARDHGRPLHLVNIQPQAADTRAANAMLRDLARQLKRRIQVRARTTAVAGELREGVTALAAGKELVVVPWQAGASWADKVLGTPPERMLRWLATPTLIVRRPAIFSYRRVLAPVKLEGGAEAQITAARYMARGQRLRVLHVLEAGPEGSLRLADVSDHALSMHRQLRLERAYTEMNALLDRTGAGAAGGAGFVAFGQVSRQVTDAARAHNAQLVVVGRGRRSVFGDVLCGGLVQDLIRDAEADLLVLPVQPASGRSS
jgi:nucleotide-binding universal stress UspA family protein